MFPFIPLIWCAPYCIGAVEPYRLGRSSVDNMLKERSIHSPDGRVETKMVIVRF